MRSACGFLIVPRGPARCKAHAQVVSKFIENGRAEAMRNHPVPE